MPSVFNNDKSVPEVYFELAADKYPGVYLAWTRLTSDDFGLSFIATLGQQVVQRIYSVRRSPHINGPYSEIGRMIVPENEFIDEFGKPAYYYRIHLLQVDLSSGTETEIAISQPMSGDALLMKASLAYEVSRFQDIPVYDDELVFSPDRTRASLGYSNISYHPHPEIRISADPADGFEESFKIIDPALGIPYTSLVRGSDTTDYLASGSALTTLYYVMGQRGDIYFQGTQGGTRYPVSIPSYDQVFASYRVRMFTHTEMNDAMNQALQFINAFPGSNKYRRVEDTPFYYEQALITIATYYLLRRLMMRLSVREVRLLFGDLGDRAGESYTAGIENIKAMLDLYKDQIEDQRRGAAYAYWPRMGTTSTETYQLPGSRSYMFRSMFNKDSSAYG